MLGRPYTVRGRVTKGDERGRTLGFPTANLDAENEVLPAAGVYAGRVRLLDEGEPRASTACRIEIDGALEDASTDADGILEIRIPPGAEHGRVEVGEGQEMVIYELDLGRLNPYASVSGMQQRLKNLGLYEGRIDGERGPLTEEVTVGRLGAPPDRSPGER